MCGICGFSGKTDFNILKKMANTILHRGPDEDGYYSDDKLNLGMRRLSIIDIATGHQPIHNEDKGIWTIFNGEIYNFQNLRKDLKKKGHQFYTDHSDVETIVHLYEEYGDEFVNELNGMFAIALWDKKKERLLLIRDRMGIKPIFYSIINGKIIFASEIKAILEHPDYVKSMNYEAVYHYFTLKNVPSPLTAFEGIYCLLPGEMLVYSAGNVLKKKWWKIRFLENNNINYIEAKDKILALLKDATRLRMISDASFGAFLSGGVDSSAIVALMTEFSDKPIKTFSLGYEDQLKNKEADLYYARKVSKFYKTQHYEYIMPYNELINNIEDVITAFDQPFSGTISTYFLSKLIKKHVKVALSGDGADELFGSYLSHRTAQPMYHFKRLYKKVKTGDITKEEQNLLAPCGIKFIQGLYDISNGDEATWRYNLYLFTDYEKNNLLSYNFKSKLKNTNTFKLIKKNFEELTSSDPLNRILEMEWNTQLPDQVLAFVDFLSMAHSIEVRPPFLDYRLVEFMSTIPGDMKIKNGNIKHILKEAVEPLLPKGITNRPKEGFVLPIFDWLMQQMKNFTFDLLSEKRLKRHGFLNNETVQYILNQYYNGNIMYNGRIWNLMMFQIWWEKYFYKT